MCQTTKFINILGKYLQSDHRCPKCHAISVEHTYSTNGLTLIQLGIPYNMWPNADENEESSDEGEDIDGNDGRKPPVCGLLSATRS